MLKRRTKRKRNPSEEEELRERRLEVYKNLGLFLYNVVEDGNPENLVNAIILYNQGYICGDCYNEELGEEPKDYLECVCEKCPHCGFRRDLCYLDIDYKGPSLTYYTEEERERVKEAGYELILEILADDVYNDGRKYNIIPDFKYKNLNELKKEFLKRSLQKDNIDLSRAKLSYLDLSNINLSNADLSEADLSEADLIGANLSGANLSGADLFGANLTGADLTEACLSEACLSGANLSGANLSGANLYRANLYRANFTDSIIKNTNFKHAKNINDAINLNIKNPNDKKNLKFLYLSNSYSKKEKFKKI